MKYSKLYNYAKEKKRIIFRIRDYPKQIVVPEIGYVVAIRDEVMRGPIENQAKFESTIDYFRSMHEEDGTPRFLMIIANEKLGEILVCPVEVFKNKLFALGVAHGTNADIVFNLQGKENIWMQK